MATDQSTQQHDVSNQDRAREIRALLKSQPLPMIETSINTYQRDLPEMLKTNRGQWVAYHGERRIGFGKPQTELVQECIGRGLTRDEFLVCGVEEGLFDTDEEIQVSPEV